MADIGTVQVHTLISDWEDKKISTIPTKNLKQITASCLEQIEADMKAIKVSHKIDFSKACLNDAAISGELFDTGIELTSNDLITLPYPEVVITCRQQTPSGIHEMLWLLQYWDDDGEDVIGAKRYDRVVGSSSWCNFSALQLFCRDGWDLLFDPDTGFNKEEFRPDIAAIADHTYKNVLCALVMLSSKGPVLDEVRAPSALNKVRAKKGKPEIFEYHILTIPAGARLARGLGDGGTHASPRLHWRRGHVRHLPTGARTMVRACLVGSADRGFIHKDYTMGVRP